MRNHSGNSCAGAKAMERQPAELKLGALLLRLLIGSLFITHLYWKISLLPGGVEAWWGGLVKSDYPTFVPAYVLSAEFAGTLLLIPGVLSRYVALYAMPMMIGAAEFWLVRRGFYFTKAGAELPLARASGPSGRPRGRFLCVGVLARLALLRRQSARPGPRQLGP
jgi:putative oxidoreductase